MQRQLIVFMFRTKVAKTQHNAVLRPSHAKLCHKHSCWWGMEERSVWMEETVKHILTVVFSEEMFRESLEKV